MPNAVKRIVIVTTELGMGGAERCVAHVAVGLDPSKYAVQVVALAPRPEPPKDALVRRLEEANIPLTFLNCRTKWQFFSAISQLKQLFRNAEVDIVWSFLFHANIVAAIASRGLDVQRLQSLRVVEQGTWRRKLQAWATKSTDRVLCVSNGVRRFAAETLRVDAPKLIVIPNGIDTDTITPTTYAEPVDRKHRLIAVGRLDPQKDYSSMLAAVSVVLPKFPRWELVIVGDGQDRDVIESDAMMHGVLDQVRLVGWQPDVSAWLRDAEVYLLTSRWEGMPNALIEAMAHGLPVITTDVEGVDELLPDSLARQVYTIQQIASGETDLVDLMEEPALRQELGVANRQQIEAHFSLRQMLHSYETMLDNLPSSVSRKR